MFLDRLVGLLLPRQDLFFTLLEEIAARMTDAAVVFGELATASGHPQFRSIASRLEPIETAADHVCHTVYAELDRTFVTPIDREDIAQLTSALDNVIDSMEDAAAFASLYRFDTFTQPMKQMVQITTRAVAEVGKAFGKLRKFNDVDWLRALILAVHTLENEADLVYRTAIAGLFDENVEVADLVRQKDMLFTLENGVDRCDDLVDVIRSVVQKAQ